jgi:hypothetical protein
MIATSKNESDMPKKKVNYTSSKEMTNPQLTESTHSQIKQNNTVMSIANKQLNMKKVQNANGSLLLLLPLIASVLILALLVSI